MPFIDAAASGMGALHHAGTDPVVPKLEKTRAARIQTIEIRKGGIQRTSSKGHPVYRARGAAPPRRAGPLTGPALMAGRVSRGDWRELEPAATVQPFVTVFIHGPVLGWWMAHMPRKQV